MARLTASLGMFIPLHCDHNLCDSEGKKHEGEKTIPIYDRPKSSWFIGTIDDGNMAANKSRVMSLHDFAGRNSDGTVINKAAGNCDEQATDNKTNDRRTSRNA